MKSIICLILVSLFFAYVYAGDHDLLHIKNDGGSLTWTIRTTNADTSGMFYSKGGMTLNYVGYDSIHLDSVKVRVYYQSIGILNNSLQGWITQDSTDITADSTQGFWNITDRAISVARPARLIVKGITGNRKEGDGCRFLFDLWKYY